MVRESARKCSHCGVNGHNSRTCNNNNNSNNIANGNNSVKIFGVYLPKIVDDSMKKSFSTGNLSSKKMNDDEANTGYLSDGIVQRKAVDRERKKGTPWSEEEHVVFLAGLKKLGKGDWRGISKKFVTTRSPSQVASHAQKYFLRQAAIDKKKRRPSVFDLSLNEYEIITPKDSPVSQTKKSDGERSSEATAAVQNVNRFPHVCIDIPPSAQMSPLISGAPNYSWCPSMVGMPGNEQFIPTVNFARQSFPSYSWLPGTQRNFGTCAPVIIHPSGIPSPKSFPHSLSH